MRRVVLGIVLVLLTAALGGTGAGAHSGAAADAFGTKANAICAKAIGQAKAAGRIYTFAHPAALFAAAKSRGASWVAVDTATLEAF